MTNKLIIVKISKNILILMVYQYVYSQCLGLNNGRNMSIMIVILKKIRIIPVWNFMGSKTPNFKKILENIPSNN